MIAFTVSHYRRSVRNPGGYFLAGSEIRRALQIEREPATARMIEPAQELQLMTSIDIKFLSAILIVFGLFASAPAVADPMKCSGEEKTCSASCTKAAKTALSICLTICGQRKSSCMKTGCWDNGVQRYCGLAKQ